MRTACKFRNIFASCSHMTGSGLFFRKVSDQMHVSTRNSDMTIPFCLVIIVRIKIYSAESINQPFGFTALYEFLECQGNRIFLRLQSTDCHRLIQQVVIQSQIRRHKHTPPIAIFTFFLFVSIIPHIMMCE